MHLEHSCDVTVLGGGRMATAYTGALQSSGLVVSTDPQQILSPVTLMAFFSGVQSRNYLESIRLHPGSILIDLATQDFSSARCCLEIVSSAGALYAAGGVTGGARQVGTESTTLLLGGPGTHELPSWLSLLGHILVYESVEQAVAAKLLHNFILLMVNHSLGIALELARHNGILNLLDVIERGTAGRPLHASSAARDRRDCPSSTYSAALASKDLRAIIDSFPQLANLEGFDLLALSDYYKLWGNEPYTMATLQI
jgi:3-hydroxyisobutyrate dehydrogenase-like beta-hydroxyacid dehydrogenase